MKRKYKYAPFDRRSRRITWAIISVVLLIMIACYIFGQTGYISAWFLVIAMALAGFCILSIPRFVRIGAHALEIHCIVEMTSIELGDIKSARELTTEDMTHTIPILGMYGFFGYYGYYYDLSRLDTVKLYATQWANFVEIEDIYEDKYIISCTNPEEFIATLMAKSEKAKVKI